MTISPYVRDAPKILSDSNVTEQHMAVLLGIKQGKAIRTMAEEIGRSPTWIVKLLGALFDHGAWLRGKSGAGRYLTPEGERLVALCLSRKK